MSKIALRHLLAQRTRRIGPFQRKKKKEKRKKSTAAANHPFDVVRCFKKQNHFSIAQ